MQIEQKQWTVDSQWQASGDNGVSEKANLVFAFGSRGALSDSARFDEIRTFYPNAHILSGTTSGEILGIEVSDDTIALTAIHFDNTSLKAASLRISEQENSFEAGKALGAELVADDLVHVFVLSDGLQVNGSELVKGISEALPNGISVTGGLAGDAANFEKTLVGLNSAPTDGNVVGIGLYGSSLKIGHGTQGGWDPFGPERIVTKSASNVLYELDGQSALDLYKTYLGDKADELPGSGLLFPLAIKETSDSKAVVRTLLAVDEEAHSMTFAGDLPEGSVVQLMKANFEKLIDASAEAAESTMEKLGSDAELAILVSCVGRKLILDQRIEEEVEEVQAVLGDNIKMTGFYSYGEISPLNDEFNCDLHNQTMTITTFCEN